MKNAILMATEFNALLPVNERPEFTQDYEGFYHLIKLEGSVENSFIQYIIRDHDRPKFELKKQFFKDCVDFMNKRYGEGCFTLAQEAMEQLGIIPKVVPIRGGTDGARLSYMGLPCPNIFAGGHNFHGKMEYVPLESMVKATEVILKIVELYTHKNP
jgi:tripeptide aminopeptidase